MYDPQKILVVYNGKPSSTSGRLFAALARAMATQNFCDIDANPAPNLSLRAVATNLRANFARLTRVMRADILVLHSYLIFSLPCLLLARLTGVRVVVFQWDIYPSTLKGRPLNRSRIRAICDRIEAWLLSLADTVIVPGAGFVPFVRHKDCRIVPLWPDARQVSTGAVNAGTVSTPGPAADEPWRICFAGQINTLRGLDHAVAHLLATVSQPIELHIFSGDPLPGDLARNTRIRVIHHGSLLPDRLLRQISQMHFGLIPLHPEMDQPGFPSKIFDMVAAGLPVLYCGPALPDFTRLLDATGVGRDISRLTTLDLAALHPASPATFSEARQKFFDQTMLSPDRVRCILSP